MSSPVSINRRLGRLLRVAPATVIVGGLSLYALADVLAGSVGVGVVGRSGGPTFGAFDRVLHTDGLLHALGFSVSVAFVATALALGGAVLIAWHWLQRPGRRRNLDLWILHVNLSLPHAVWAVALLATFSQSGLIARLAASVGLMSRPASFPLLVQDRHGIGIVLHLVTKELPFVVLAILPLTGRRLRELLHTAATLGASPWHCLRHVFLPTVAPALVPAAVVVFAFALGSYEPGALLGVQHPRTVAVIVLDRFRDADPVRRSDALALSVVLAAAVLVFVAVAAILVRRRGERGATR